MNHRIAKPVIVIALLLVASAPAHAFRCGTKLVKDGMHEQQVIAVCGEPTSVRHLGYAIRSHELQYRKSFGGFSSTRHYPHHYYPKEVAVSEYIYNFGPRRFMRRLIFEDGVLVKIENVGYGYIPKKPKSE